MSLTFSSRPVGGRCLLLVVALAGCASDPSDDAGSSGGSSPTTTATGSPQGTAADTSTGTADATVGGTGGDDAASGTAGGDPDGSGGAVTGGHDGGSNGGAPADLCPSFAAELVDVTYGDGAGFGQDDAPGIILGPPHGGGCCLGSLDVLSLGNGGSITVGFLETRIVDGEGPDLVVFENAFLAGGDPDAPFVELGTVEVSADGDAWHAFPCTAVEAPYGTCAGVTPVHANPDENDIDPLDPAVSGGDLFDLADVGLREARWVRIVDRPDQTGFAGIFDLDAVGVLHGRCTAEAP